MDMQYEQNWVLWVDELDALMKVEVLPGEYTPFRDFERSEKKHTSGRREINAELLKVQLRRMEAKRRAAA